MQKYLEIGANRYINLPMTKLTDKDIKKIAKLSRISVSDEEIEKFSNEISGIMDWIDQLSEVDTDSVAPIAGVGGYTLRYREKDEVTDGGKQSEVLSNAPKKQFGCYVVPKVVDAG